MKPIQFLQQFHPDRPWVLTAIEPSQKGIETRAFAPDQTAEAEEWIESYNGKRNLYFSVAEVIEPEDKKAGIENVKAVHWLHVDIDAGAGDLLKELERIKKLVTTELPGGAPEPTCVIYSGGGYQAFWRLAEAVPIHGNQEAAAEVARYNRQLELIFGGDSCHNVDRIMRLPGTMNIPNQRKIQKGRVPVQAEVVSFTDTSYPLVQSFSQAADVGRSAGEADDVQISANIQRLATVDDLDNWNVPDRVKVIIVQGRDPDNPKEGDDSRSAWLFDATCQLVRAGVPDDTIYSVLTDPDFKISESVLEAGNSDRYAKKQIKSAKEAADSENLYLLNSQFAVIGNLGGRCVVIEEVFDEVMDRNRLVKQSFTDFRNRFMNQFETMMNSKNKPISVPLGKWWLENPKRRQYDRLVFVPNKTVPNAYNLWQGYGCNALPGDGHESFLAHLRDTICQGDDATYTYLIGWMARTIQHPELPGHTAVVMRGRQGTGKSFLAKHFGRLVGRHFLHVSNANHLIGQFNGHLRDAIVVFGDEAFYAGDKRHESVLKTLITEETLMIETKGVDAEAAPNFTHLILASNSEWVVPMGWGDRRYFVVDVGEEYAQDRKHFGKIAGDLERGGYENLLYYLMNYDLTGYNVQAIPDTDARRDQRGESMEPHEEWWLSVLEDGQVGGEVWPRDQEITVSNAHVLEHYREFTQDTALHRKLSPTKLGNFIKRMLPGEYPVRKKVRVDGPPVNARVMPPLDEARAVWDRVSGANHDWQEVDLTGGDLPF
jgi:hypothetical protein